MGYRLTHAAERDLEALLREGYSQYNKNHVEAYWSGLQKTLETLAQFPDLARLRTEISPPVRIFRYQAHIIVYTQQTEDADILILRVRYKSEDWQVSD